MLTIKLKIVLAYTLVFGLILSLFAYIIYNSTKKAEIARLDSKLKSYSIILQAEIEEQSKEIGSFSYPELKAIASDGLKSSRFQLINSNGENIIGDTILTNVNKSFVNNIIRDQEKFENVKIGKHHYRAYLSGVEINEKITHILIVSSSLEDVREDLERILLIFLIAIPAGLIIAGFSAFFITQKAFKPINKMISIANEISAFSLDRRLIVPDSNDEIKALSLTLNSMIDRIDKTFKVHRQFIANASHEIRTPLTIIQTELELSLWRIKDEQSAESIKISLKEIANLDKLTNSLLTLAKIDAFKNELSVTNVRMDELVLECVQLLKTLTEANNNHIKIHIDEVFEIQGDKEKLKSIVTNLLENALKYSGKNKQITLGLKKINNEFIHLIISDNGSGIPNDDLPYIFERFYRSNEIRSAIDGNGLGLAIVKEFVRMHSGEIFVTSKPGDTIFTVKLPISINNCG